MKKMLYFPVFCLLVLAIGVAVLVWKAQRETRLYDSLLKKSKYFHVLACEENRMMELLEKIQTEDDLKQYGDEMALVCKKMRIWSDLFIFREPDPDFRPEYWEVVVRNKELLGVSDNDLSCPFGERQWNCFWDNTFKRRGRIRYLMNRLETRNWDMDRLRMDMFQIANIRWSMHDERLFYVDDYSRIKCLRRLAQIRREMEEQKKKIKEGMK